MLSVKSAFSKLLFTTVRVECRLKTGGVSTGTAFFLNFKIDDNRTLPLLVTNKHVVEGAEVAQFHVHEALPSGSGEVGPSATSFPVTIAEFQSAWFMHPDPSVDLCVMPFEPLRQQAQTQGKIVFCCPLD